MKLKYSIVLALVCALIAFFIGRSNSVDKIITKYVKGEMVTDTLYKEQLKPIYVYTPYVPLLPTKPDTINNTIVQVVDTSKIIADYVKENSYSKLAFDDENGKLTINSKVQYNEQKQLSWSFTPIQKEITVIKKNIFTPFLIGSYNSFGELGAGGGLFYHNFGLGVKYITNFNTNGFEISTVIKF